MITAAVVPTIPTLISPANTARAWAVFQNTSTASIWVKYDPSSTTLTTTNGILIPTNGTPFRLDKNNDSITPFGNPVYAISSSGNPTLVYHDSI